MTDSVSGGVKGNILISRLAFVREKGGDAAVTRVLARLPEDDRRILSGLVMPVAWFPFDLNERLDAAIAAEMAGGEEIFRELGRKSASDNLAAAHRVYIRDRDPHGLLKQAASIYRLYYDTGHRTYERLSDRSAVLRTFEARTFSRPDCLTVAGWHERAIEMCGGTKPRTSERKCRSRGDDCCEYLFEWD